MIPDRHESEDKEKYPNDFESTFLWTYSQKYPYIQTMYRISDPLFQKLIARTPLRGWVWNSVCGDTFDCTFIKKYFRVIGYFTNPPIYLGRIQIEMQIFSFSVIFHKISSKNVEFWTENNINRTISYQNLLKNASNIRNWRLIRAEMTL